LKAQASDETPDEAATQYQWAIARKPDDLILHYNYGLFLFDYNRAAAAEQLRMSRPWDGFPVFAPDGTPIQ
jgi:Tfp pilus assembly protein PilF